jgi:hypothetical protein
MSAISSCASWDLIHYQNHSVGYIHQRCCNWYTESTTTGCRNHHNVCERRCNRCVVIIAFDCWNNCIYSLHGTASNILHFCKPPLMCLCEADLPLWWPDLGISPWLRRQTSPLGHNHPRVWVVVAACCNTLCDKRPVASSAACNSDARW